MKKNKIVQYRPKSFEGFENKVVDFDSLDELLSIDFVNNFKNQKKFERFCLGDKHLMAIYDNGFHWFVVGLIDNPDLIDLPKWDGGKYKVTDGEKEYVFNSSEVYRSNAYEVTLKDGRKFKSLS